MAFSLPSDIQNRGQKKLSGLATLAGTFVKGDLRNRQVELSLEKERAEKMFIRSTLGDLYGQLEGTKNPMDYNKRLDESSLKLLSYGGEKSATVAEELGKRRLRLPSREPRSGLLEPGRKISGPDGSTRYEDIYGYLDEEGKEFITNMDTVEGEKPASAGRVVGDDGFYHDAVRDAKGNVTYKKSNIRAPEGTGSGSGGFKPSAALKTLETKKNALQRKLASVVKLGRGIDLDEIIATGEIPKVVPRADISDQDYEKAVSTRKKLLRRAEQSDLSKEDRDKAEEDAESIFKEITTHISGEAKKDLQEWLDAFQLYEERAKVEERLKGGFGESKIAQKRSESQNQAKGGGFARPKK